MEEWKDIKGYEGIYQISNKGRVKSLNRIDLRGNKVNEKIREGTIDNTGYKIISLSKNGKEKKYSIHRLVAQAFLPNPNNLPVVNHKDENKLNNNVENLEWCTQEYNVKYSLSKKIICLETGEIFNGSQDVIDRMFNGKGHFDTISKCCLGKRKSAFKYHFKYIEE